MFGYDAVRHTVPVNDKFSIHNESTESRLLFLDETVELHPDKSPPNIFKMRLGDKRLPMD